MFNFICTFGFYLFIYVLKRINLYISDIERGRDHGLSTYNDFRELCKLPRILDFGSLMNVMNQEVLILIIPSNILSNNFFFL